MALKCIVLMLTFTAICLHKCAHPKTCACIGVAMGEWGALCDGIGRWQVSYGDIKGRIRPPISPLSSTAARQEQMCLISCYLSRSIWGMIAVNLEVMQYRFLLCSLGRRGDLWAPWRDRRV